MLADCMDQTGLAGVYDSLVGMGALDDVWH